MAEICFPCPAPKAFEQKGMVIIHTCVRLDLEYICHSYHRNIWVLINMITLQVFENKFVSVTVD